MEVLFNYCAILLMLTHGLCSADNLVLVNVLYRHGDRNAIYLFPNDNNTVDSWSRGLGELTEVGIGEEYELGEFLKTRYTQDLKYLNADYTPSEIYVQSTDVNRCLMSAQAVLAGLYPPSGEQKWRDSLDWQPIPVHTVPSADDQLFSKAPCERLWEIGNASVPIDQYNYIDSTYREFLQHVHDKAGYEWTMNHTNIFGFANQLQDTLFVENLKGRYLPPWANATVLNKLDKEILPLLFDFSYRNEESLRLRGGALLHKMLTDLQLQKEILSPFKMFMYSGHDSTVRPFLAILHEWNNRTISYATAVFLELYERTPSQGDSTSQYYVQLWLRMDKVMKQLPIKGCNDELDCELSRFIKATSPMTISDRLFACHAKHGIHYFEPFLPTHETLVLVTMGISAAALLLLAALCMTLCWRRCRQRRLVPRKYRVMHDQQSEQLPMINSGALSDDD